MWIHSAEQTVFNDNVETEQTPGFGSHKTTVSLWPKNIITIANKSLPLIQIKTQFC